MPKKSNGFNNNVFINCPFDKAYKPMLKALLFTFVYSGFNPIIANEKFDSLDIRLKKIQGLIKKSKYSIHDISRMKSEKKGELARFNMPFELGIDYGCRAFGKSQFKKKKCLILEEKKYGYLKAISDLGGVDIKAHKNKEEELVDQVRSWLITIKKDIKNGSVIWGAYNDFTDHFDRVTKDEGWRKKDHDLMGPPEYIGYIKQWMKAQKKSNK